jgi:hypothetical protein
MCPPSSPVTPGSEVVRYLIWRPHKNIADTEAYIAGCLAAPPASSRTDALVDRTDDRLIGAFHLRRPEPYRLDCGYLLGRPFWGRDQPCGTFRPLSISQHVIVLSRLCGRIPA